MKGNILLIYEYRKQRLLWALLLIGVYICSYGLLYRGVDLDSWVMSESIGAWHNTLISEIMIGFDYFAWLIAVLMAFHGFSEYAEEGKLSFFRSLPYTKKRVWIQWFFMGVGVLTFAYFIIAIVSVISYAEYFPIYQMMYLRTPIYDLLCRLDTAGNGLLYIMEHWIICLAIYALAVFARMVMNHLVGALLTFVGILAAPYLTVHTLLEYRYLYWQSSAGTVLQWLEELLEIFHVTNIASGIHYYDGIDYEAVSSVDYRFYYPSAIFLWLGIAVVCSLLAYHMANQDHSSGKIGKNAVYENIFIVCTGLYVALLIPFTAYFRDKLSGHEKLMLFLMLIAFGITEVIMVRLFKGKGKYDHYNSWKSGVKNQKRKSRRL